MKLKTLVVAVLFQVFVLAQGYSAIADKLPSVVVKAIAKYGTEAEISEYDQYEDESGKLIYAISIEKPGYTYYLEVSEKGEVISEDKVYNEEIEDEEVEDGESWD